MFSVLMSVYKNDEIFFFRDAVESVVKQTILPEEFVLVCDGPLNQNYFSEIEAIGSKLSSMNVKFVLVKLECNVGLGLALREGIKHCSQKYIIRMDSDDISRPTRIEKTLKFIKENPDVDVFGSSIEEFYSVPGDLKRYREVPISKDEIIRYGKNRNPMNHVTVCMRKESILAVGNYESVLFHEDYYLWVKLIMANLNMANVHDVFVDVRVGNDLIGRRKGFDYLKLEFAFAKKCKEILYFNFFDFCRYLLPRIFLRLLPRKILSVIYKKMRS
ncbi:glycosyltransferase [Pseudoalteromonas sp. JBTF-M23]|uniref:Glycosyltransferase n=1 Tax=Pseudoalteromonas caenipelagi TaxID=2726988 RepID=A0A849VED9_9GAMM|nr:glycosyltransferase [Pseudoalteromonas caenipelagi]NOU51762.1 glycosyltransferase [Pseudoalteromonas caenipelagi]